MPATRTQVYLTEYQRQRVDEIVRVEGVTMATVVRRALDAYLESDELDPAPVLAASFGADPQAEAPPRAEWDRG